MLLAAILLLLAALACVAAELFLPTHGILALCAALLALGSIILAYNASPALGIFFGMAVVIVSPIVFYWAIRLYPHTPMGKRVMLRKPGEKINQPFAEESQKLSQYIGKRGTALSTLRPSGIVEIDGDRIDCISESEAIPAGTPVEIIRVIGLKAVVKPLTV
jgi:membrane-bound ClpP family serine protease